ncbi:hypothetical protein ACIP4S_01690 [Streptomyces chartreusis]|uniref:hypothetical protein n=1 Tax=Streptomyces chartreusis TaxID=1969 RepID=UPI00380B7107
MWDAVRRIEPLSPTFVPVTFVSVTFVSVTYGAVTYGAGGSSKDRAVVRHFVAK